MRLTDVRATRFRIPFRTPLPTAAGRLTSRDGFMVRLATDTEVIGVGEASPHPALGAAAVREVETSLERLRRRIVGAEILGDVAGMADRASGVERARSLGEWIDGLRPQVPPALVCALEVAAADAIARAAQVRLCRLFGGKRRDRIAVNAIVAGETPGEVASEAAAACAAGFRCVKLKAGLGATIEAERRRVAAARHAIGDGRRLRLDANGAWTAEQAIAIIRALERYDLELVEQPVAPGELAAMRRVRQAVGTPLAADEDVCSVDAATRVLDLDAADMLVIKPMVVGGLRAARAIADLARSRGVAVIVTTTIDAGIGTAAALHLAASLPDDARAFGLATGGLLSDDLIEQPLVVESGEMVLPDPPGLGVTLDERELARYSLAGTPDD